MNHLTWPCYVLTICVFTFMISLVISIFYGLLLEDKMNTPIRTTMLLKQQNKELVISAFREIGQGTRNEIAQLTGLSISTCGNIIRELVESGELSQGDMPNTMQKCKIITQDINNQNQPFPHLFLCPLSTVPPNVKWPIGIHFLHPNYYKTTFRLTFATLMVSILPPKFCPTY